MLIRIWYFLQDGEGITERAAGFIGTLAPEATAASERSDAFGGESVSYQVRNMKYDRHLVTLHDT